MKNLFKRLLSTIFAISISSSISVGSNVNLDKCMILELKYGEVEIKFRPDLAPGHVARIIELANEGFYNNVAFHRVIPGFMAQTGDPTGTGSGGSGTKLKAEFSSEPHVRGTVSMARANDPNSGDSQFFIVYEPSRFLDGKYTVFGEVIKGMEYIDLIKKGTQDNNGAVTDPDRIISAKITDCK